MSGRYIPGEPSEKEYRLIESLAQKVHQSQGRELTLDEIRQAMNALRQQSEGDSWVN